MFVEPSLQNKAYEILYKATKKYLLIADYYSQNQTSIDWRGSKIYKYDYAGAMLDIYPNMHLLDYGFFYHKDNNFPMDDINWFLLEKK